MRQEAPPREYAFSTMSDKGFRFSLPCPAASSCSLKAFIVEMGTVSDFWLFSVEKGPVQVLFLICNS